jgi:hypothetical protein
MRKKPIDLKQDLLYPFKILKMQFKIWAKAV